MVKGFKEFIMRGNLVELAVAFIIATAFAAVVKAFVGVILGIIGKIGGNPNFDDVQPGGLPIGVFVTSTVTFLIIAAVVYFGVVVPYNALQERRAKGTEEEPPSDDVALLTEIRNLLAAQAPGQHRA